MAIVVKLSECLGPASNQWFRYRLAGRELVSDLSLQMLRAYLLQPTSTAPVGESQRCREGIEETFRSVSGWLAGDTREVACTAGPGGYRLDIAGSGRFQVEAGGDIDCRDIADGVPRSMVEEVLLGPPVAFSLALHDIWCLHASAVRVRDAVILFVGESGRGKSTLAAFANRAGITDVERVGDDIMPCSLSAMGPLAWPHFPQLKLAQSDYYPIDACESLPIRALVVLEPLGPGGVIRIDPRPAGLAAKALIDQTVAVSLFDRPLHEGHLAFISGLVSSAPVHTLQYPHDLARLPDVYRELLRVFAPTGGY